MIASQQFLSSSAALGVVEEERSITIGDISSLSVPIYFTSKESSTKIVDVESSRLTSSVQNEKSIPAEAPPQEDDALSSILLMLKSNTNDDDDVAARAVLADDDDDDLEALAHAMGEDCDPSGLPKVITDRDRSQTGASSSSSASSGNGNGVVLTSPSTLINYNVANNSSSNNGTYSSSNITQKSSISRNIKIDDLRSYFHLPIVEVAKQLGICTTLLKRVCRMNKIKKWPYRQIRSIAKSIQSLEMASMNGLLPETEIDKFKEQITFLKRSLEALIDDPSIAIEAAVEMAMRTVAEDGSLPDFVPNSDLNGDENFSLKPTAAQVIAASVASSSVDRVASFSKPRPPKRKKNDPSDPSTLGGVDGLGSSSNGVGGALEIQAPVPTVIIGESIVMQSLWSDGEKQRVTYLAPVQLAPLIRKKQRNPFKKQVTLIEPDICNCFQMDFLPLPLLRLSQISSSSSQVAAALLVAEAASDAFTSSDHLGNFYNNSDDIGGDLSSDVIDIEMQALSSSSSSSSNVYSDSENPQNQDVQIEHQR